MQSDSSNIVVIVTGKQVAKVKIGYGPDAAAFDAERGLQRAMDPPWRRRA